MNYTVTITYPANCFPNYDDSITSALGDSDGSGMGFGERDHSYYFENESQAKSFVKRAKKALKDLDSVKINMTEDS